MSASRNADAMTPAQGEFNSHVERDEPMMTKGHAPGVKVGNDTKPEFHAQTLPASSVPSSSTYTPNPVNETPGQANNASIAKESWTPAADTIVGASSADVHKGYGVPPSGQTAREIRGGEKKERSGLEGRGAGVGEETQRVLGNDRDHVNWGEGKVGHGSGEERFDYKDAGDRLPVSSEELAAERT